MLKLSIPEQLGQYHGCSCLGFLGHQVISNHGTEYTRKISITCGISVLINDRLCKYIFMFCKINSVAQGLSTEMLRPIFTCALYSGYILAGWCQSCVQAMIHTLINIIQPSHALQWCYMRTRMSPITENSIFCSTACSGHQQKTIKPPHLCRECTGHRRIPLTKGQWCSKCLHVLPPSCVHLLIHADWSISS